MDLKLSASAPPPDFCPSHHAPWLRACKIPRHAMKETRWFKARALSQALGTLLHGVPCLWSASEEFFGDCCHWDERPCPKMSNRCAEPQGDLGLDTAGRVVSSIAFPGKILEQEQISC